MHFNEYKYLVKSDLYRYTGRISNMLLIENLLINPGFQYSFWMRTCAFLEQIILFRFTVLFLARIIFRRYTYKYGISIPYSTKIGSGFYIGHFGGIVVNAGSVIGKNCNISQCVTLGQANRGKNKGYPVIGDNVYIGPGAKIIGKVNIGNNAAIGANCVVTKDAPDNAVVVGVPGEVISYKGSQDYVNRTDYPD
jgi:serine O-acetyltransferase